jgi:hypothetical protein
MKNRILPSFLMSLIVVVSAFSQDTSDVSAPFVSTPLRVSIQLNMGYPFVSLNEVRQALERESQLYAKLYGEPTAGVTEPKGKYYWDGAVIVRFNRLMVGLIVSSKSTKDGRFVFRNQSESFEETFTSRALEVVPIVGIRMPVTTRLTVDFLVGGGYGTATTNHSVNLEYVTPRRYLRIEYPSENTYLPIRAEICPRISIGNASLSVAIGYHLADAGLVKGADEPDFADPSPYEIYNKEVRFNLSGVVVKGGVSLEF